MVLHQKNIIFQQPLALLSDISLSILSKPSMHRIVRNYYYFSWRDQCRWQPRQDKLSKFIIVPALHGLSG
jgi:hypothetical protein